MVLNTLSKEFKFRSAKLLTIFKNDEYFFKGKDVCDILGYENSKHALERHIYPEYKVRLEDLDKGPETGPLHPQTIFVREPGLYQLIFGSKLPAADKFRKWIFEEVIPSLRKKGFKDDRVRRDFAIRNEYDLHKKVVDFIRRFHPELIIIAGLGENQITSELRISSWHKGYTKGQPDLIINNFHKHYSGFCIEFKHPKGTGELSIAQKELLENHEDNSYKVLISHDYDEIIEEIIEYSKDLRYRCGKCSKKFRSRETLRKHKEGFRH